MNFYIYFDADLRRYFATRWKEKEVYNIRLVDVVTARMILLGVFILLSILEIFVKSDLFVNDIFIYAFGIVKFVISYILFTRLFIFVDKHLPSNVKMFISGWLVVFFIMCTNDMIKFSWFGKAFYFGFYVAFFKYTKPFIPKFLNFILPSEEKSIILQKGLMNFIKL